MWSSPPATWLLYGFIASVLGFFWYRSKVKKEAIDESDSEAAQKSIKADPDFDLQSSISSLPDALILLGAQWQLRWANQTACDWFGINLAQSTDHPVWQVMNIPGFVDYLSKKEFGDSFDCQAPADTNVRLGIRIVPYRENQFLLQGRDITKIGQLEQIRRDFVANASHELRTPLSILYGYLEMMRDEPVESIGSQWKPAIEQMFTQTERIKQIIDDMMLLSRLEQVDTDLHHEFHPMAPLMHNACKDAEALSVNKGHIVECQIDENYSLLCDAEEIRSLITNLISNAVRYTPDNGTIEIRWKVDLVGGYLSVIDTGIGIEEKNIPRLTERFYRTDPARSKAAGGTGLGLAIVNHIVNRHQAKLIIRSKVESGSEFMVHFPSESIRADHEQVNLLLK
ncbi:MAG: phosphate regulon sensor histidine kinase PhoR [Acidiferrobacterales bacterium]|nr:phosphate regulon sensor histidine kinase PhoR [Acidiferrobacterales bacterium]